MRFTTHHASVTGLSTLLGLAGISAIIFLWSLMNMANYCGTPSHSAMYTDMKYQEYLIKNPGVKLYMGGKELSQYKNQKFQTPAVLALITKSGQKCESFLDDNQEEVIGNKLLAKLRGS